MLTRGKSNQERAADFLGYLAGEDFDFFFDEYASNGTLYAAGMDYEKVKSRYTSRFSVIEPPEEKIRKAVSASLDASDLLHSLSGMDSLFHKAGFDDCAKFGLLRKAVKEFNDLVQFVTYQNPTTYETLKKSVSFFVSAKESFNFGSVGKTFTPTRVI